MNDHAHDRQSNLPSPPPVVGGRIHHDRPDLEVAAGDHAGHSGHGWMMIVCCIPMLVIAVVLVLTGVASVGFLGAAIACTVMMALMMRGMDHGGGDAGGR